MGRRRLIRVRDCRPLVQVTCTEISPAALRGTPLAAALGAPLVWGTQENTDAVRAFVLRRIEHLPDARWQCRPPHSCGALLPALTPLRLRLRRHGRCERIKSYA